MKHPLVAIVNLIQISALALLNVAAVIQLDS